MHSLQGVPLMEEERGKGRCSEISFSMAGENGGGLHLRVGAEENHGSFSRKESLPKEGVKRREKMEGSTWGPESREKKGPEHRKW